MEPIPILQYQCTALVGPKSSGKSTTMLAIYKEFLKQANGTYDFLDPFNITHASFTNQIYISPTADIDLTLQRDPILKGFQLYEPSQINPVCERLMQMQKDYIDAEKLQATLITYKFDGQVNPKVQVQQLRQCVRLLEIYKKLYPELLMKANIPLIKDIYRICSVPYDGLLIRRPKISLILDDIGSERQVSGNMVGNPLFSILKGQRHYSVYCSFFITHTLSLLYGQIRDQFNCFVLKRNLNQEHLKLLFQNQLGIQTREFTFENFMKMYEDTTQNAGTYNFLYILTMPITQIWQVVGNQYNKLL